MLTRWRDLEREEQNEKLADLLAMVGAAFFIILALLLAPNL